jgi:hypothetical protein
MEIEINERFVKDADQADLERQGIGVTPPIFGDYWKYRIKVSKNQAIIAFPKFFTIGIGFQYEKDWNCNLPYTCDAVQIYEHIRHNRLDARKPKCINAILMIQEQITKEAYGKK